MSETTPHPDEPPPSYESVIQTPGVPYVPGSEPKDNYNIPPYGGYPVPQQTVPTAPDASRPYPTQPYPTQPYHTQPMGQYPPGYPQPGYGNPAAGAYPVQGQQPYNMPNYPPPGQVQAPATFTTNTSLGINSQNNLRKKRALLCTTVMIAVFIAIIIFIMQISL
ncbi:protein lifeguard 1-like [Pecten maximus]|uniref:protein lifeguard 1-like n=1 Tax=Pecten maximus TaxID=6579 RepID=UPI0014590153|nr:protein lifeguard 1-like [Pecten maximus]